MTEADASTDLEGCSDCSRQLGTVYKTVFVAVAKMIEKTCVDRTNCSPPALAAGIHLGLFVGQTREGVGKIVEKNFSALEKFGSNRTYTLSVQLLVSYLAILL